jgi:segregation and condensation protein B
MSLKAKIEAVIYASEEPVTLAQLAGLLGEEIERELENLAARQQTLALDGVGSDADNVADSADLASTDLAPLDGPDMTSVPRGDESAPDAASSAADDVVQIAAEKRKARERERQVRDFLRSIVDQLIADYADSARGLELREVAGGFRMATKPEYHDAVRGFVRSLKPPLKLTLQALETLAVVAYKQPVTAPEVSEIRGVDSSGVLGSLMTRKLVTTAGRKPVIGRPILYKTTKDFLLRFGLKDVSELPSIEEFEKMAGELATQEEILMPDETQETAEQRITHENLEEEKYASEPQADGNSDSLEPDESNLAPGDTPTVDGRMSGLPPREDAAGDDPSAEEAAIQSGQI